MREDQVMLGLLFGSAAFLTWGLQPIYLKAVAEVPALEMLALRVASAAAFMALAVIVAGRWSELCRILGDVRIYRILVATASLIATNWLVFIWAIANAHVVQCSLGFFMTPLVDVALGVLFLRERLRRQQLVAIGLAAAAIVLLMINAGEIPWIALTLAVIFGLYGLLRKLKQIEAVIAVTVEMFLLTPFALAYLIYLAATGTGALFSAIGLIIRSWLRPASSRLCHLFGMLPRHVDCPFQPSASSSTSRLPGNLLSASCCGASPSHPSTSSLS